MKRIAVACILLAYLTPAWGGALDLQTIPGSANWMLHVDTQAFWASKLGQSILGDMDERDQQKRSAAKELIGFDVIDDLHSFTLYGPSDDEKMAVTLARGKFDSKKLLAIVALSPEHSISSYREWDVHRWLSAKDGKVYYGAFVTPTLIAISQSNDKLRQAIDTVTTSSAQGASFSMVMNAPPNAFVVAYAKDLDQLTADKESAAILRNSKVLAFVAHEDAARLNATVQLTARSAAAAEQIQKIIEGLLAFSRLQEKDRPEVTPLLESLTLTREAADVKLQFSHDSSALYDLLRQQAKAKAYETLESL